MSTAKKIARNKKKAILKVKNKVAIRNDAQESANFEATPAWAAGLMQTVKDISQRMDEIDAKTKGGVPREEEEIEEEEEEIEEEEEEVEEEEEETAVAKDAVGEPEESADNGARAGREFEAEEEIEEEGGGNFEGEGESPVTASAGKQKSLQRSKSSPTRAEYDVKLEDGVLSLTSSGQSRQDLRGHGSDKKAAARMDAIIKKQSAEIAELKKMVNKIYKKPSIEDMNKIAAARKRADALYTALGRNIPEHLHGESARSYRARLADGLKDLSSTLKKTVFDALPYDVFGVAEERIYQDAMSAIKTQSSDIKSTLRAHKYVDETGHHVTEYYGNNADWMKPFMSPGFVSKINRQQGAK